LYRREGSGLHLLSRWSRIGLRMIVLLGVLVMLLETVLIFSKTEYVPSVLIVLSDGSESMSLRDAYVDLHRATATAAATKLAGEPPAKAGEFAAAEGVTVVSLATGTPEGPRAASLTKIDVSPVVFVRDPNPLHVLIESRGMAHQPATVVLERSRDGGPWEEIGR